jgi:hypothetical protein
MLQDSNSCPDFPYPRLKRPCSPLLWPALKGSSSSAGSASPLLAGTWSRWRTALSLAPSHRRTHFSLQHWRVGPWTYGSDAWSSIEWSALLKGRRSRPEAPFVPYPLSIAAVKSVFFRMLESCRRLSHWPRWTGNISARDCARCGLMQSAATEQHS